MLGTSTSKLRRLAVMAGVLALSVATIGPVVAASPVGFKPRDAGQAWDRHPAPASDRVIVTFRHGTSASQRARIAASAGMTRVRDLHGVDAAVFRAGASAGMLRRALAVDDAVLSVSPDSRLARDGDPTGEPGWPFLWGLDNTGQAIRGSSGSPNVDIDGLQAEGVTGGDPAVVVAVIDDGVDFSHPDLAARAWTNPGESGPDGMGGQKETNGIDDDGNGYIDDVHGWDFCNNDNTVHDFDHDFHGTHVAGTIAASLDGQGIVGVAPNVSVMALKFLDNDPAKGCGLTSMAVEAIAYAKSFGVTIANASWGGRGTVSDFQPLYTAIRDSGMLFVASAGNDGIDNDTDPDPSYPASFDLPNIVSVAAVDKDGGLAAFSNYGHTTVDIAAPGVDIVSALPADSLDPVGWGWLDGTSMAAPHVTGVAALMESLDPSLRASARVSVLRSKLLATGKSLPLTVGDTVTGRMVDARFAIDGVKPIARAPSRFGFVAGSTLGRATIDSTVAWSAGTDDASGIRSYDLEQQVGSGAWAPTVSGTSTRITARWLSMDATYHFRVRARDRAGNVSTYATGPAVVAKLYQETTSLATYGGTWASSTNARASGGRTRYATRAGAWVSFRFTGWAAAIVAPRSATRGSARVYADGVYVGTIDLHQARTADRVIVFGRTWSTGGAHTLKLVLAGTSGRPRVDVDAFGVLR